jgi:hypothetical protein
MKCVKLSDRLVSNISVAMDFRQLIFGSRSRSRAAFRQCLRTSRQRRLRETTKCLLFHPQTWQRSRNYCRRRSISSPSLVLGSPRPQVGSYSLMIMLARTHRELFSGIPTFRGPGGMWRKYDAMSLATYSAFLSSPSRVWQFYHYRREKSAEPSSLSLIPINLPTHVPLEPSPHNLMQRMSLSPSFP